MTVQIPPGLIVGLVLALEAAIFLFNFYVEIMPSRRLDSGFKALLKVNLVILIFALLIGLPWILWR